MAHTILSVAIYCLKLFKRLVSSDGVLQYEHEVPPALWNDELGRLRVWIANIGAHQTGQSSLDYRLRDASHVKVQVSRLLRRLERACGDAWDILDNSAAEEEDESSDSDGDSSPGQTELQRIYHTIRDTLNCLFRMSMVIRQPAQHDRLRGARRSDTVHFEPFDRQHVLNKYPNVDEAIVNRLGTAISQRRSILGYRKRHHMKLSHGIDRALGDNLDTVSTNLSETMASEFVENPTQISGSEARSIVSQTSYATTFMQGDGGMTIPPPPTESEDRKPFECPYCFYIISISDKRAWARHIFTDILPYICVFPDCLTPHRLYESRRAWFSHLRQQHLSGSEAGITSCPLCREEGFDSGSQLEKHLGRHLEELALFALPRTVSADDDDNPAASSARMPDDNSDEDSTDQGSVDMEDDPVKEHLISENATEKKQFISFEDAVGRVFSFPFETCRTWNGIKKLIYQACGEIEEIGPRVAGGQYNLIGPNGNVILPHTWERVIEPGWAITMRMWQVHGSLEDPEIPPSSTPPRGDSEDRLNEYFIPGDGISREVIQEDICRYLGNDALVRLGSYNGKSGYFIRSYRNLTSEMIRDLKADSARWEAEKERRARTYGGVD